MPYYDLSLQHVSKPLLRRMRRWGDGDRFLRRIDAIRTRYPDAAFRSNFIVGYPGETEEDHDQLLDFVDAAQLDWCGFFAYSQEDGTYAAGLDGAVPRPLMDERLAELRERQDEITAARRDELIGTTLRVLVDAPGTARGHREAPRDRRSRPGARLPGRGGAARRRRGRRARAGPGRGRGAAGDRAVSHDPNAIATWANAVTVARVMISPVLFALITGSEGSWVALALWIVLCASDGIDGFLARRYGTTRSGAFLDPLADKVLVLGAMFTLVGTGCLPGAAGRHHRHPRGRRSASTGPSRAPAA